MNNLQTLVNLDSADISIIIHTYSDSAPYHTSIDVKTTGVYNLYEGVICDIGNELNDLFYVCIKLSNQYVFKYGHLKSVSANIGSRIRPGELLGVAEKYCTFEYLTQKPSRFLMYIDNQKFYKNNPTDIIVNNYLPTIQSSSSSYKTTSDIQVVLSDVDSEV